MLRNLIIALVATLGLAACRGVDLVNALTPKDGYQVTRNVAYGDKPQQRMDIYTPDHRTASRCAIVFFYGGSWQDGSKDDYTFAGEALSETGCVVAIPDYRVYPDVSFPTFITDSAAAVAWVQKHADGYDINQKNIFIAGHSAGAYNAAMVLLYPPARSPALKNIRGLIGLAGPYDFLPLTDKKLIALFSTAKDQRDTQPITYVDQAPYLPPTLLLLGDDDTTVGPYNSHNMAAALRKRAVKVTLKEYKGVGHIGMALSLASGFRAMAPTLDDIKAFIARQSQ